MNRPSVGGVLVALITASSTTLEAQDPRTSALASIDARRDHYAGVARQIWDFAEVGFQERRSSALLQEELRAAGFQVEAGVAGMPTAFMASHGSGRPVIDAGGLFNYARATGMIPQKA